jgi:hypothetical protein
MIKLTIESEIAADHETMIQSDLLNKDEIEVLELLVMAYNKFLLLEQLHYYHQKDFMDAIHKAQRLVMVRPTARDFAKER